MPSIEKGGVEKNFFAISNFLTDYIEKITIITANNNHNNKINNKIFIKCPSNNFWNNKKRIFKRRKDHLIFYAFFNIYSFPDA